MVRWEDEIVAAILTWVTSARLEALNRIARHEARQAYSFRNPAYQRCRIRTACTRDRSWPCGSTARRSQSATGQPPDPG
jgi:hypothetical protein